MRTDMQLRDNMSRSTAERKQAERDRKFREACDAIEETEGETVDYASRLELFRTGCQNARS